MSIPFMRGSEPLLVDILLSFIGRLVGSLRVTRPAADEIDFRNELLARFGKTD